MYTLIDGKPEIRDLNTHVIPHLAQKWKDLGWQLLKDEHGFVIDQIENGFLARDVQQNAVILFSRWLNFGYESCNWTQIIASLEKIGLNALAAELRGKLRPGS